MRKTAEPTEFRRPDKSMRRAPLPTPRLDENGKVRVTVSRAPFMTNMGFDPTTTLRRDGFVVDEKSKSDDGQRFDMVCEPEVFKVAQERKEQLVRRRAGSKQVELPGGVVAEVEVQRTKVSGAKIRREIETGVSSDE